jgi:hypothetical protein
MGETTVWTDAQVVAEFTCKVPLSRYCLIDGSLHQWYFHRGAWRPGRVLIDDDSLSAAAPDAFLRAGVCDFQSYEEAAALRVAHLDPLIPSQGTCSVSAEPF